MKIDFDANKIMLKVKAGGAQKLEQFAQIVLDDSNEFIPRDQDDLMKSGKATRVSDEKALVGWYTPYANYQFRGEVYVDPVTGAAGFMTDEGWKSRKGVTKVPGGRPLQYSKDKNPNAQKEWFEAAKAKHKGWSKQAQKLFGGE